MRIIPSNGLSSSDLVIDAVYEGGSQGNAADDPISKILEGVGNQGGFRAAGRGPDKKYVVLYTSGEDKDWPDTLDLSTGQFIYFGDSKAPGHELHETTRGGNEILRRAFEFLHASPPKRATVVIRFVRCIDPRDRGREWSEERPCERRVRLAVIRAVDESGPP